MSQGNFLQSLKDFGTSARSSCRLCRDRALRLDKDNIPQKTIKTLKTKYISKENFNADGT